MKGLLERDSRQRQDWRRELAPTSWRVEEIVIFGIINQIEQAAQLIKFMETTN